MVREPSTQFAIPTSLTNDKGTQYSLAVNYSWTMSSNTGLAIGGGMMRTREAYTNPDLGVTNDDVAAGIQGFPTAGREKWIGPPNINLSSGYTGIGYAGWGVPGQLYGGVYNGKADIHSSRGAHTLAAGVEYASIHTYGDHRSEERRVGKECRSRWSPYH